jgi:arylsulfatase A-like enzyme
MNNIILKSTLLGLSSFMLISCLQEKETSPPNFIVFIADDVSWNDFGCYGNTEVYTPNIDRIAVQGIKFTNTYLTASSCSPSRVSILSGRYPHNTGACELHTEPPVDLPGIADVLKNQGYYCGQAGKWHAGEFLKSGFDTLHTKIIMNGGEGKWLEMVETRPMDKPFFFWLASIDAHRDWGENEFSGTHNSSSISPPLYMSDGEETRNDLAQYYDEITRFDYYIGQVESLLEEQGALDNTLFIIMADNGRPFPGCKTRVYDRGMKTPFIISWKNGISQKNSICESMVSVIDIAPTLADLAGSTTIPESFQGKSFASLINDPSSDFRTFVFSEHNWHDYEAHERMVRTKDHL